MSLTLTKKIFLLSLKKYYKEDSKSNNDQITWVNFQLKIIGLDEYNINDILFNILCLHDMHHPSEAPLVIGTLIPLGPSDNKTYFIYEGPKFPTYEVLKVISKHFFSSKKDYLSKTSFIYH